MVDPRIRAALRGDLRELVKLEKRVAGQGVTRGLNKAGTYLQNDLRRQTRRAGLGMGLEKAWRKNRYPQRGHSMGASVLVFSKADRVHEAFSADRTIQARNGNWLAIPLPPAIAHGWDHDARRNRGGGLPRRWANIRAAESAVGPLRMAPIGGDKALLIGRDDVAYFLLLRQVRLRKKIDIEGATTKWSGRLPGYIVTEINKAAERAGL